MDLNRSSITISALSQNDTTIDFEYDEISSWEIFESKVDGGILLQFGVIRKGDVASQYQIKASVIPKSEDSCKYSPVF